MADLCPFPSQEFGYAVAGFGPAGCGFLVHAIKANAVERLVDDGLIIIDRATIPGAGKVGRYQLTGNSLSRAFLDCIDDPDIAWLFDDLNATHPSIRQLRELEFEAPPLDIVGDFLEAIAKRTMDHLIDEYGVPFLLETDIDRIERGDGGSYTLHLGHRRTDHDFTISASRVVCTLGGRQAKKIVNKTEIAPGITLGNATRQLFVSDDFLMMDDEAIRAAMPMSENSSADIVVVGGSHSAISTIDRLSQALAPAGLKRLTMLHGPPLRLYYASPEEAHQDNYPFLDPEDICPMSGRVNRFGGLRYRSLDVAKSILKTGRMPEHDVEINWLPLKTANPKTISRTLNQAPAVIACMGYQANLPPIVNSKNIDIPLCNWPRGVEVDENGQVMTVFQGPMEGMFVIGIGSTLLRRSDAIGGEPSFRGSADGVWLYHNHGGGVILNALKDHQPNQEKQRPEINRVPSDVQVYK
ncbi:MAG: hypothetical protein ACR2QH_14210 [Geminicoccaceae bacterium]